MTLAELLDDVRGILQDRDAVVRYSDEDLVRYAQQAVSTAFRLRPDLAIGESAPAYSTGSTAVVLPVELTTLYAGALAEHVAAAAERRDSQFSEDARLAILYGRFEKALMSGGS